jgi:hypothetical protein
VLPLTVNLEITMPSAFREFCQAYEEFKEKFPRHPLIEELRDSISRGKFPTEEWLRAHTKKLRDLLAPLWQRSDQG